MKKFRFTESTLLFSLFFLISCGPLYSFFSNNNTIDRHHANQASLEIPQADVPYQNTTTLFPSNAIIVAGTHALQGGGDTITVQYYGNQDATIFDCHGSSLSLNETTESKLYVSNGGDLVCTSGVNKKPNVLIEGVQAMQIRYGEDIDKDGIIDHYVTADYPGLSVERVRAIKIHLLILTHENGDPLTNTRFYKLQDVEFGPYEDLRARKIYKLELPANRNPSIIHTTGTQ